LKIRNYHFNFVWQNLKIIFAKIMLLATMLGTTLLFLQLSIVQLLSILFALGKITCDEEYLHLTHLNLKFLNCLTEFC